MATQVTLTLIAIALCMQSSLGQVVFYWGKDANYNAQCPDEEGYTTVAKPAEECDVVSYIMCSNGQAIASRRCPEGQRFDPTRGWCATADAVPLPANCDADTAFQVPQTCAEGATYLPAKDTCRRYIWCLYGGAEHEMPCNDGFYYIHNAQRCIYPTRVSAEYQAALEECIEKDPYPTTTSSPA